MRDDIINIKEFAEMARRKPATVRCWVKYDRHVHGWAEKHSNFPKPNIDPMGRSWWFRSEVNRWLRGEVVSKNLHITKVA